MFDARPYIRQLLVDVDTPRSDLVREELDGEARLELGAGSGVYLEREGGRCSVVAVGGTPEAAGGAVGVIGEGGFTAREGLMDLAPPGDRHRVVTDCCCCRRAEKCSGERGSEG